MRAIEVGAVKIHLGENEEPMPVLQSLMRPLNNKEIAAMIGISERTVVRWKQKGRLPARGNGQVFMLDMLRHLTENREQDATALPGPARTDGGENEAGTKGNAP